MFESKKTIAYFWAVAGFLVIAASAFAENDQLLPRVSLLRVHNHGIQPQVAVDRQGVVHMIYIRGDPAHGDIDYVRLDKSQETFPSPLRVNSTPGW